MSVTMAGEMVPVTQPPTWMTNPSWFLVAGLPWPEDEPNAEIAEAALAVAPYVTQAVRPIGPDGEPLPLGRDFALMLDAGARCAAALGKRVLFLSDITRWLADSGLSWQHIGVSFEHAQDELERQKIGLYLTVSQRAYSILCTAARTPTIKDTSGMTAEIAPEDREMVRAHIEAALDADWADYLAQAMAAAQPAA
jgi:hypothetical protein